MSVSYEKYDGNFDVTAIHKPKMIMNSLLCWIPNKWNFVELLRFLQMEFYLI